MKIFHELTDILLVLTVFFFALNSYYSYSGSSLGGLYDAASSSPFSRSAAGFSSCIDTTWSPSPANYCESETFTQISNCGRTRTQTGWKECCAVDSDCPKVPSLPGFHGHCIKVFCDNGECKQERIGQCWADYECGTPPGGGLPICMSDCTCTFNP